MCTPSLEERFVKIVTEMDAELVAAKKHIAELESKFRVLNFPNEQATNCGKCGVYKHTPWRDDQYGYVCATCLRDVLLESFKPRFSDESPVSAGWYWWKSEENASPWMALVVEPARGPMTVTLYHHGCQPREENVRDTKGLWAGPLDKGPWAPGDSN
jgi:hypothetical protein